MWIDPGRGQAPGREGDAAHHAGHVLGDHLLVADPVLHAADRAVGEHAAAGALIAAAVTVPLVARIPSAQGGISAASVRACTVAVSSAWPVIRRPSPLIAATCSAEASNAHTSTLGQLGQVGGVEAADRAAADDADASRQHARRRARRQTAAARPGDSPRPGDDRGPSGSLRTGTSDRRTAARRKGSAAVSAGSTSRARAAGTRPRRRPPPRPRTARRSARRPSCRAGSDHLGGP